MLFAAQKPFTTLWHYTRMLRADRPSDANIEHSLIVSCNAADDLTGLALSPDLVWISFLFGTDARSGWSGC